MCKATSAFHRWLIVLGAALLILSGPPVYADLSGDLVDGVLSIRDINTDAVIVVDDTTNMFEVSLGLTMGSGTPQTVGPGGEFFIHDLNAGAYGNVAIDQFLDIDVDINANDAFFVTIGGNFLSNPGGIIPPFRIILSNLGFGNNPNIVITGVSAIGTDFVATVTTLNHRITLTTSQFSTTFGGPASLQNGYAIDTVDTTDTDGDGIFDTTDNCTLVANANQRDTDADDIGNICDPDVAQPNNCLFNFADLIVYQANIFQPGNFDTDNNGDGTTNFADLLIIQPYFFGPPGPSAQGCN